MYRIKGLTISFYYKNLILVIFKKLFLAEEELLDLDFDFKDRNWPAGRSLPLPSLERGLPISPNWGYFGC